MVNVFQRYPVVFFIKWHKHLLFTTFAPFWFRFLSYNNAYFLNICVFKRQFGRKWLLSCLPFAYLCLEKHTHTFGLFFFWFLCHKLFTKFSVWFYEMSERNTHVPNVFNDSNTHTHALRTTMTTTQRTENFKNASLTHL